MLEERVEVGSIFILQLLISILLQLFVNSTPMIPEVTFNVKNLNFTFFKLASVIAVVVLLIITLSALLAEDVNKTL